MTHASDPVAHRSKTRKRVGIIRERLKTTTFIVYVGGAVVDWNPH
jgi:hypothetical protein